MLLIGGRVRGRTLASVDRWALQALADSYVDVAFLGTNGVSVERGLTTPDTTEAAVKRAMISAARRAVLLTDHTKIGNDHLARFASVEDIDVIVTDSGIEPEDADRLASRGPRLVIV